MGAQHHIIRRQFLHVELSGSESDGLALQRRLPEVCQSSLMLALERILERLVAPDEHLTLERLEVDAGVFTLENLERDLAEAVAKAVEKQLVERGASAATVLSGELERRTEPECIHEAFIYFLKTGLLPWWFHLPAGKTLEEVVVASWITERQTKRVPGYFRLSVVDAIGSTAVQKRLIHQFSANFLKKLLEALSSEGKKVLDEVFKTFEDLNLPSRGMRQISNQLWQTIFIRVAAGKPLTDISALIADAGYGLPDVVSQEPALREKIQQQWPELLQRMALHEALPARDGSKRGSSYIAESLVARKVEQPLSGAHDESIDLKEGIHVHGAGVVLLHPFLPRFFEALGIAAEDRLLQPERALCLLHFLATGQRQAPEYELLLPKLLCNVPFETPVESLIDLTAAEEEEAMALLNAVIHHWDALRNTSADGLRGTFLLRPGILTERADGDYLLQVERQSFDLLLDQLPWGIGAIKLPWMERMLWVEWWQ